jgi:hypothetical protein
MKITTIGDVQSYRIAAQIVSNSCVDRLLTFSTASTSRLTDLKQRREATPLRVRVKSPVGSHGLAHMLRASSSCRATFAAYA